MKQNLKRSAKRRLSIAVGQVRGVGEMIEEEKYCVDILTQIEAAREALAGVGALVLENHLSTHVAHMMKHGKEKRAIEEILTIYRRTQK